MELILDNKPFRREVREWQRMDLNTGVLLSGRFEANRCNIGLSNKYGKVIDSQNLATPDGLRLMQRKELELMQARTEFGSLQVIRSSTTQSTSSKFVNSYNHKLNEMPLKNTRNYQPFTPNITNTPLNTSFSTSKFNNNYLKWDENKYSNIGFNSEKYASISNPEQESDEDNEFAECKRVSHLRRSLQYPKAYSQRISTRPKDFPENLVSISNIKKNLENDRLNNKYNDYVDLKALDNVLINRHKTVDSINDNRSKLKRINGESISKDDYLNSNEDYKQKISIKDQSLLTNNLYIINKDSNGTDSKNRHFTITTNGYHMENKSNRFNNISISNEPMSRTETLIKRSREILHRSPTERIQNKTCITFDPNRSTNNISTSIKLNINSNSNSYSTPYISAKTYSNQTLNTNNQYVDNLQIQTNSNAKANPSWSINQDQDDDPRRLKKVNFSKTEVHFAAESGRLMIVETDTKPPSTHNFRRRNRHNTCISNLESLRSRPSAPSCEDEKKKSMEIKGYSEKTQFSITTLNQDMNNVQHADIMNCDLISETDGQVKNDIFDNSSTRGILKNKQTKPKTYHFGENIGEFWGVRLKHVPNGLV